MTQINIKKVEGGGIELINVRLQCDGAENCIWCIGHEELVMLSNCLIQAVESSASNRRKLLESQKRKIEAEIAALGIKDD